MSKVKKSWGIVFAVMALTAPVLLPSQARADADLQFAKYLESVKWSGDYRLRYDSEHFRNPSTTHDRPRFRMRLRLATDFGFPGRFTIKTRLASGVGEQTSTNQTFGSLNTQKGIYIDRAYAEWKPKDFVTLSAGKMAMPLLTQYSSDAVWDTDLNPEGAGQQFSYLLGGVNLFFNAMQIVADESGGSNHAAASDQYIFSEQIGLETRLPFESRFKVAYAYHDWHNPKTSSFTGVAFLNGGTSPEKIQEGNRRTANGFLANDFKVQEIMGELSTWIGGKPLSLQGTFIKNNGVSSSFTEKKDTGYQTGAIFGKAGTAKMWEVAYFYKHVQTDATVADAADSDFGDGGTNRRGHIMWLAYSPFDYLTLQTKYFQTKNIERSRLAAYGPMPGAASPLGTIDRIQVDAVIKF